MDKVEVRFWSKVNKTDGCWIWLACRCGGRGKGAYGAFRMRNPRRYEYAHRVSYRMKHGDIPKGMQVLHSCDNPLCVNPAHLRLGTVADNVRDMVERGRTTRPGAILTPNDVRVIRERLKRGEKHHIIAMDFPVGRSSITQISRGFTWCNIL